MSLVPTLLPASRSLHVRFCAPSDESVLFDSANTVKKIKEFLRALSSSMSNHVTSIGLYCPALGFDHYVS